MMEREDIRLIDSFIDKSDMNKKIWRYMSLEKLESIFKDSALYFASAEQFIDNDNHEGAITEKEYESRKKSLENSSFSEQQKRHYLHSLESAFKPLRKYAKISCWHINPYENIAMWHYYQGVNKGIAIETSIVDLLANIGEYRIQNTFEKETINVAIIKYINYLTDEMNDRFGFLTPFLYKRVNYAYENEFRLIISLRIAVEFGVDIPNTGILVPFNFSSGIKRIILSPDSDEIFEKVVKNLIAKYNVEIPIVKSELSREPKY